MFIYLSCKIQIFETICRLRLEANLMGTIFWRFQSEKVKKKKLSFCRRKLKISFLGLRQTRNILIMIYYISDIKG